MALINGAGAGFLLADGSEERFSTEPLFGEGNDEFLLDA
jgi:hypothetical protein